MIKKRHIKKTGLGIKAFIGGLLAIIGAWFVAVSVKDWVSKLLINFNIDSNTMIFILGVIVLLIAGFVFKKKKW